MQEIEESGLAAGGVARASGLSPRLRRVEESIERSPGKDGCCNGCSRNTNLETWTLQPCLARVKGRTSTSAYMNGKSTLHGIIVMKRAILWYKVVPLLPLCPARSYQKCPDSEPVVVLARQTRQYQPRDSISHWHHAFSIAR